MKKSIFVTIFILLFTFGLEAQMWNRMVPKEIKKAYLKGTRSVDGRPGVNYWQNHSDYVINASLIANKSRLNGHEKVVYHNDSPDTLTRLVIRMYQNFYKKGGARSWKINAKDVTNGVNYNHFNVTDKTGKNIFGSVSETGTNMIVRLKKPLLPNDSLYLETDWSFHIPQKSWNRMGNYGKNNFMIGYWYPQIAVYDDIDGWDKIEFNGVTEFYNDFNNYDVKLTMPPGFMVWATGMLQNEKELYNKKIVNKIDKARQSDEITTLFTADDCRNKKVLKDYKAKNVWHFKAKYVTDFTFGANKAVNWQGSSLVVDTITGRRTFVDAVYPDSMLTFPKAAQWCRWSVNYMSKVLPGVPYPYPHMTTWSNGRRTGGMESPMMANDGDPKSVPSAQGLFFHEILHSYFPFYMGTNERKYAWMDEGWAAYLTNGIMEEMAPKYNYFQRLSSTFETLNGSEKEVTLMTLSYMISNWQTYRSHAYNRPSMAYHYLRDMLGDSLFIKGLHVYMMRWHGRHPMPYDFFASMEAGTGMDLKWYFIPWFFKKYYADLGIKKVTLDNKIVIQNWGGLPLPVKVACFYTDGTRDNIYRTAIVWKPGEDAVIIKTNPDKKIDHIVLGDDKIPDINNKNNNLTLTGNSAN